MHSTTLITLASLLLASAHPSPRGVSDLLAHPQPIARRPIAIAAGHKPRGVTSSPHQRAKGHLGLPPPAGQDNFDLHEAPSKRRTTRKRRTCQPGTVGELAANATVSTGSVPIKVTSPSVFHSVTGAAATPTFTSLIASASASASASISEDSAVSASASSSAAASPSPSSSSGGGSFNNASSNAIFPLGTGSASWTTDPDLSGALSFTGALNPLTAGNLPATVTAPDGSQALSATYPAGIVGLKSGGGYSFYTEAEHNGVDVTGASEVTFTYSVYFPTGFDFVKGGKLPGIYGGVSLEDSKTCSGGRQTDRSSCFSARTMWRTNGMGEIYNYLPPGATSANPNYCSIAPQSLCNPAYGDSIGRGAFTFATGAWTTISQRFKMNDFGQSNGEQELFVNGESKITISNMAYAQEQGTKIYGIMAQTFFGGSDSSWASPTDQTAYFKDWSMAILA